VFHFQEILPHNIPVSLKINAREITFNGCSPPATGIAGLQNKRIKYSIFNRDQF
jgi:hypothetical protein